MYICTLVIIQRNLSLQSRHTVNVDTRRQSTQKGKNSRTESRLEATSGRVAANLAVVDEQVYGVRGNTGDDTIKGSRSNAFAETLGALTETEEVSGETGNVGASHGSAGDGVGAAADPGAEDIGAGGKNIDESTDVGVSSERIVLLSGANGAGRALGSGGEVFGVDTVVTGGDGEEVAGAGNAGSGLVDGRREVTAEGHVDDNTVGAILGRSVIDDEVHTGNDIGAGDRSANYS